MVVLLVVPSGGIPNMVLFEMLGGDTHHATCQNPELRSICLLRGEMGVDDDEEKIVAKEADAYADQVDADMDANDAKTPEPLRTIIRGEHGGQYLCLQHCYGCLVHEREDPNAFMIVGDYAFFKFLYSRIPSMATAIDKTWTMSVGGRIGSGSRGSTGMNGPIVAALIGHRRTGQTGYIEVSNDDDLEMSVVFFGKVVPQNNSNNPKGRHPWPAIAIEQSQNAINKVMGMPHAELLGIIESGELHKVRWCTNERFEDFEEADGTIIVNARQFEVRNAVQSSTTLTHYTTLTHHTTLTHCTRCVGSTTKTLHGSL